MTTAARLVGRIALARRHWMSAPTRTVAPHHPVISIGNLAVGGRGKTPLVAEMCRLLVGLGERPAILTRGYARRDRREELVIVHDGQRMRADLSRAGDEPTMLASTLSGVAVVVCADRALAAVVAESQLRCTVHVLDDGFQHVRLRRDLDCVSVTAEDVTTGRVFPSGRLREPLEALECADLLFTDQRDVATVRKAVQPLGLGAHQVIGVTYTLGSAWWCHPWAAPADDARGAPAIAVAGIARPERFVASLRHDGWSIVDTVLYPDHHAFTHADLSRMAAVSAQHGHAPVVTTEKDLVRLLPHRPLPFRLACVPLHLHLPIAPVADIVVAALADARQGIESTPCAVGDEGRV